MNDNISLREARSDDLPTLGKLAGHLVRMHHGLDERRFIIPENVEEGYARWFAKELAREEVVLVVAEHAGVIVGYAYGRLEERDWNQLLDACGALHDIWVEEGERRLGVASALIEGTVAALLAKGAPRVVLHTASQNLAAQALFARHGFRPTMVEMTRDASVTSSLGAPDRR